MKKIKYLLILLGVISLLPFAALTSNADETWFPQSIFSPSNRQAVEYKDGIQGFSYPSFNNFIKNPNISEGGRQGDERAFMVAKYCPNGICCEKSDPTDEETNCFYYNYVTKNIKEGDVLRFEIYFHNNAEDPYDKGSTTSPDARNVKIGIDLSDISPTQEEKAKYPLAIRPKGFIYADNNEYRTNKDDSATVIKINGQTVHTATDDITTLLDNTNLKLTPVEGSAWLAMKRIDDPSEGWYWDYNDYVKQSVGITFDKSNGPTSTQTIHITPKYDGKKAWLEFDRIPGCFRYSGFAYFEAKVHVEKKQPTETQNFCKSANIFAQTNTCSKTSEKIFQITLNFDDNTNLPSIKYITFDSKDKNATLKLFKSTGDQTIKMPAGATSFHHTEQMIATTPILRGSYIGTSELTATYTDEKGNPIKGVKITTPADGSKSTEEAVPYSTGETPVCTVKLAPCSDCGNICVSHSQIIQTGTYSEWSATALDTNGANWPESITYSVDGGDGKFYTKTDLDTNKDGAVSDDEIKAKIKQDFPNSNPQKNTSTYENCLSQPVNLKDAADVINLFGKTFSDTNVYQYTGELKFTSESIKTAIPKNMEKELYKVPKPIPPTGDTDPIEKQPNKYFMNDVLLALTINKNLTDPLSSGLKTEIKEYSTSTLGSDKSDSLPPETGTSKLLYNPAVTVAAGEKVWFYADKEGTGVIHVKANNTNNTNCEKSFTIVKAPTPEKCGKLNLTFKETTPPSILNPETAFVGTQRQLNLEVLSGLGKPYPSKVKWTDSTNGKIIFPKFTTVQQSFSTITEGGIEKQLTIYETNYPYPAGDITFFDSTTPGAIKAEVVGEENICFDSVKTVKPITPPITPVCKSLTYTVYDAAGKKIGDTTNLFHLAGPDIFKIKTDVVYDPEKIGRKQVTYDAVSRNEVPVVYGYFAPETEVKLPYIGRLTVPQPDLSKWSSKLERIDAGTAVYFMANPDRRELAPGIYKDAIRIKDSDSGIATCSKSLALTVYKPEVCQNITVKPNQSEFNPTKLTNVFIDETASNFGEYKGDYKFTVTSGQAVLYTSKAEADAAIAAGKTELTLSKIKATKEGVYIFVPSTETKEIVLQIVAADPAQKGCAATLKYTPVITPKKPCGSITLAKDTQTLASKNLVKLYIAPSPTSDFGDYNGKFKFNLVTTESNVTLFPTINTGSGGGLTQEVTKENALAGIYLYPNDTTKNWKVTVEASEESPTTCKSENSQIYTPPVTPICKELTITKPSKWIFDTDDAKDSETQDFAVNVTMDPSNTPYVVQWSVSGNDPLTHFDYTETTSSTNTSTNTLNHISTEVKSATAKVKNSDNVACQKTINLEETGETPPSISKFVKKGELDENDPDKLKKGEKWDDLINVSGKENNISHSKQKDQYVTYKVVFKSGSTKSAKIREEEMNDGKINGFIKGKAERDSGYLEFTDKLVMKINSNNKEIDEDNFAHYTCEYNEKTDKLETSDLCITNENKDTDWDDIVETFSNGEDLFFNNLDGEKISIYYEMENKTVLDPKTCAGLNPEKNGCGEEFDNTASFDADYDDNDADGWNNGDESDEDSAKVIAVCPYILTRTSGDVFFNKPLDTGIDVAYCSPQKNIIGPIITPIEEKPKEVVKSGEGEATKAPTLSLPSHDICKFSNVPEGENMPEEYKNPLKNFSSTICEMKADVAEWWLVQNVKSQIIANVEKISRWSTENTGSDLASPTYQSKGLVVWNGTDVTLNTDLKIGKNLPQEGMPASRTYIIKNGDLIINNNVTYNSGTNYGDPKSVPSAAFIVINGNIIVGSDVTELAGTYIAVNDGNHSDKGRFTSSTTTDGQSEVSYEQLTVTGSLIGDVSDLFGNRKFVGDISSDEGSVTIKYSENFLLNTPPGLSELMNINQFEVAY